MVILREAPEIALRDTRFFRRFELILGHKSRKS
jgi:hypothetical protein